MKVQLAQWGLTLLGTLLLISCSEDSSDALETTEEVVAQPVEEPEGTCGTDLLGEIQARLEAGVGNVGRASFPLPVTAEGLRYTDGPGTTLMLRGSDWFVDRVHVEADELQEHFLERGPWPVVNVVVPAVASAEQIQTVIREAGQRWRVRFVVTEEAFVGGATLLAEESHRRVTQMAEECPALRSLPGADGNTIRSGMANGLFEGVNTCCSHIDADELRDAMLSLYRPTRWVPWPHTDPAEQTVQEWINASVTDDEESPERARLRCLAGEAPPDSCN